MGKESQEALRRQLKMARQILERNRKLLHDAIRRKNAARGPDPVLYWGWLKDVGRLQWSVERGELDVAMIEERLRQQGVTL